MVLSFLEHSSFLIMSLHKKGIKKEWHLFYFESYEPALKIFQFLLQFLLHKQHQV